MRGQTVLAAVQYLDRGELKDIVSLVDAHTGEVFTACRQLEDEDLLEETRPMTYRLTDRGVERLEDMERTTSEADDEVSWESASGGRKLVLDTSGIDESSTRSGPVRPTEDTDTEDPFDGSTDGGFDLNADRSVRPGVDN